LIAKILIDLSAKEVNQLYDYLIPENEINNLKVGMRVLIPFGEMERLGFVMEITNETDFEIKRLKEIKEVIDLEPVINAEQIMYLNYLDQTNYGLYIDSIKTILPRELFLSYRTFVKVIDRTKLTNDLKLVLIKDEMPLDKTLKVHLKQINKLKRQGVLKFYKQYERKDRHKYIDIVKYNYQNNYQRISNYDDLISFVKNNELTKSEIVNSGFSLSSINTLIKHEVFYLEKKLVLRSAKFSETDKIPIHTLNSEQELAYNKIIETFNTNRVTLLNGITGSGKTEVYMHVIGEALKRGMNVLYLIPEISLVAPTVKYLKSRFKTSVTHYNSSLSSGERFDAWYQISENEAKIIVGTRSSAFLPIQDLGIIIVDEEHDESFNQVGNINYQLIDILNIKKDYFNIPLLLGSATPKITSMYYAKSGDYQLLNLTKLATNQELAKISFVDMKDELKAGNLSIFSHQLKTKIKERLEKREQTILLYNRLGYSSFVLCRNCSHVPKCPNCDISLTYFKEDNELKCSHCQYKEPMVKECPSCQSSKINTIGMGIEQVIERVRKEFKDAKVLKMDSQEGKYKGNLEQIWLDFQEGKADILVGTKMVSKGLDFPNVTLVGILMADLELKAPTYLAGEQTYQMLKQMVGRSGRHTSGEAVIQSYDLESDPIKDVNHNYDVFYQKAILKRELLKYPPFNNIYQVLISHESYLKAYQIALSIKKQLNSENINVLGPSEPYYKYLNEKYRFVITIKTKKINYQKLKFVFVQYSEANIKFYNNLEIL